MTQEKSYAKEFNELKIGVLIPTFNNARTLKEVISSISKYTQNIVIVNDGSTDETEQVIKNFPYLKIIQFEFNKGKGIALRKGFEVGLQMGYQYLISIDSDGQHFASDLPKFLECIKNNPNSIIIGARNMDQASVPGKSSFGNKFSNFWFNVETGIKIQDTQSGYRSYPIETLKKIKFFGTKFEFEVEVLVRAAWKGIKIISIPVSVYYAPATERVTHFRPLQDFTRISILNIILVFITFLYIKPRNFFRIICNRKKLNDLLQNHLFHPHHPDWLKAFSVGFGIFMGIIPIWGFQMAVAIFIAVLFKLNKPLVIIAANISIPPMIPLIIFGSYEMGGLLFGKQSSSIQFNNEITLGIIKVNWEQYLYGSILLAFVSSLIAGTISFILLKILNKRS